MPVRIFSHYVQLPIVILGAIEILLLIGSLYFGAWVRFAGDTLTVVGPPWFRPLVFASVVIVCMVAMGLYQTREGRHRLGLIGIAIRLGASFVLSVVGLAAIFYLAPGLYLGRGSLSITFMAAFASLFTARFVFYTAVGDTFFKPRVLIYGAGEKAANLLATTVGNEPRRNSNLVGFVRSDGDIATRVSADKVIDCHDRLSVFAVTNDVDEIVVAIDDRRKGLPVQELLECKLNGVKVSDALTFFERETGKVKLDLLYPSWMIFSEGFAGNRLQSVLGRAFDILASLALLLVTWPIMVLVAIAIVIDDGLPILYRQARVGFRGEPFQVLKFRSMHTDAEKDGVARWASADDNRITRVGRVIRKFRFDELPQIFNVLRGDMRFVGPRPERPDFVDELSQRIPYYRERHCVKPGITGWAQLRYEYGASHADALEKLQYDLYYVKNRTLLLDMMILLQTAEVILWRSGAR
ncbi:MAG: TIGR03013 family PEP-CTERM/XrtA system glycosyltransferase [Gammaproteobacteria bacterium]|nr:TIGR03013 family PEP-CTERM/XrtA system glycosyltransferase [Gammaproteobacteria bacterium]